MTDSGRILLEWSKHSFQTAWWLIRCVFKLHESISGVPAADSAVYQRSRIDNYSISSLFVGNQKTFKHKWSGTVLHCSHRRHSTNETHKIHSTTLSLDDTWHICIPTEIWFVFLKIRISFAFNRRVERQQEMIKRIRVIPVIQYLLNYMRVWTWSLVILNRFLNIILI